MLVYYFVPFIVSNRYLISRDSNGHNSVTVQNRTHVYMNFFYHKDLGNHLLQLCPKVVKHPVYLDNNIIYCILQHAVDTTTTTTSTVCYTSLPVAKTSCSYILHNGSSGNSTTNTSSACGVPTR